MSEPIIQFDRVGFSYGKNSRPALSDVSLTVGKGTKSIVLGANGAGKSTLFGIMNALYKPDSGTVFYKGEPLKYRRKNVNRMRSEISILFQNPDDMLFRPYVGQDVAFGPENLGLPKEEVSKRVDEALFMVGMSGFRDKAVMRLSYGQRKRVTLAGVIAMHPEVLILDEPTAGLDPQMSAEVMEIAEQLHRRGTTVIMSSHDTDLIYSWADEIHVLRGGKCIFSGDAEDFYSDKESVYLSGLLAPSIFRMNEGLSGLGVCPKLPYPRSQAQLSAKTVGNPDKDYGTLHIIPVESGDDINAKIAGYGLEGLPTGLCGMSARRAQAESKARIDFFYNGPENCTMSCLAGSDAVLVCDPEMLEFARRSSDFINGSGYGKIPVRVRDRFR